MMMMMMIKYVVESGHIGLGCVLEERSTFSIVNYRRWVNSFNVSRSTRPIRSMLCTSRRYSGRDARKQRATMWLVWLTGVARRRTVDRTWSIDVEQCSSMYVAAAGRGVAPNVGPMFTKRPYSRTCVVRWMDTVHAFITETVATTIATTVVETIRLRVLFTVQTIHSTK